MLQLEEIHGSISTSPVMRFGSEKNCLSSGFVSFCWGGFTKHDTASHYISASAFVKVSGGIILCAVDRSVRLLS